MKLVLIANSAFKLVNFRAGLLRRLLAEGHELVALVPPDRRAAELAALGLRVIVLPMQAQGTAPLQEARLLARIFATLRRERPDAVLGFTIKPNIYGALAARALGIPFIPNVTGLGSVFDAGGLLPGIVRGLYRVAFRRCPRVFLQNPEDLALFVRAGLVSGAQTELLPGSGVDLARFAPCPLPGAGREVTFLLVARMLRDKGVEVFAEAAARLRPAFPQARFLLLGPCDPDKPGGLGPQDLARLARLAGVVHLGQTDDVRPHLAAADCVVLPSFYREGTPRSLLEAAAMGRIVITTDMPGCRDTVADGATGFLCPPRDAGAVATAMARVLEMPAEGRAAMGRAARSRMEARFDEERVIGAYARALATACPEEQVPALPAPGFLPLPRRAG